MGRLSALLNRFSSPRDPGRGIEHIAESASQRQMAETRKSDRELTPQAFQALSPIHDDILEALYQTSPRLVLCLSKQLYAKYIPKLYSNITINSDSIAGLWRTYSSGNWKDNNTIRAYKHTKTLHILDINSAHQICTITTGDQPVYVPHSDLFENTKQVEIAWEVYLNQGDKEQYYMYIDFARQLGRQLREGTVEDLVLEIKDGSTAINNHRSIIREIDLGIKAKAITLLLNPDIGERHDRTMKLPIIPPDLRFAKKIRYEYTSELDTTAIEHLGHHIKKLSNDWKTIKEKTGWINEEIKIEYCVLNGDEVEERVNRWLRSTGNSYLLGWKDSRVEILDLAKVKDDLRWSTVMQRMINGGDTV
ncbi:uncharacterized protein I303_102347 [Kwoniella dejecticola CBS 10117]|uniref:Uncharacterized protein n=1 Tax=Kwoniella dejecticola CBS 10117 TaxID=1296121 RepID=A0A1A6AB80_9TREE|nr:uncharacterized protein I303_01512 [Kwoniella dejecticola CBS 10117]OBR87310.1 hypothetical protein I303_01512 [Kwoniella dejecticola CBS 10117]